MYFSQFEPTAASRMLFPTAFAAMTLYGFGYMFSISSRSRGGTTFGYILGFLLLVPSVVFLMYYAGLIQQSGWFLEFRSLSHSEVPGGGVGFIAGFVTGKMRYAIRGFTRFILGLAAFCFATLIMLVPFLNPVVYPLDYKAIGNNWSERICTQTTEYTAGPCAVATILKDIGKQPRENLLAREMNTSRKGTDPWEIVRALRKRRVRCEIVYDRMLNNDPPFPSIAQAVHSNPGLPVHYLAILGYQPTEGFIIGDPLEGKLILSKAKLNRAYRLTGVYIKARY